MLKKVQFVTDADMLQNELSPQQRKITEKYIYRTKCKKKKFAFAVQGFASLQFLTLLSDFIQPPSHWYYISETL